MTIEFSCEICGKSLSTSDDKAGRKAKCPGCGEMLVVPELEGAVNDDEEMQLADDEDTRPDVRKRKPGRKITCPMCGENNSASATKCKSCGEPLESVRHEFGATVDLGDIMSTAWATYTENLGYCVGGNLVAGIVSVLGFIPLIVVGIMIAIAVDQQKQDPPPALIILAFPAILIAMLTSCYLSIGLTRMYLGLARGDDVGIGTIFSGGGYFLTAFLFSLVFYFGLIVGSVIFIIPGVVVAIRFWPFWYILAEAKKSKWDCLGRALKITGPSWTTSLLLWIITVGVQIGMAVVGALPCIGPILALANLFITPFIGMLMTTAYVQMSHGEIPE